MSSFSETNLSKPDVAPAYDLELNDSLRLPGQPFGKYQLHKLLGQGGMAEVWLASLHGVAGFEKPLVLKRVLPDLIERPKVVEMFIREAKISSGLQHANIVQIFELGEVDSRHYIAMEYVHGVDLYRFLYRAAALNIDVPIPLALHVMAEVLRGLDYAHRASGQDGQPLGLVHHDVSPSNILIGLHGAVKIADFGVARARLHPDYGGGSFGALRGKLGYLSPEQVEGRAVDHRSDLFSAGICLYELLTRKRLFRGRSAVETVAAVRAADIEPRLARHPEIPAGVQDVLRRALSRVRDRRYQTAGQFVEALDGLAFDLGRRVGPRDVSRLANEIISRPVEGERPAAGTQTGSVFTVGITAGNRTGSVLTGLPFAAPRESGLLQVRSKARTQQVTVQTPQGRWVGPFSIEQIRAMVIGRRIVAEQRCSVEGGEPRTARALLAAFQMLTEGLPASTIEPTELGLYDRMSAVSVVGGLATRHESGRLLIHREDASLELWYTGGRVTRIDSSVPEDQLGPYLVAQGVLNRVQLDTATARAGTLDLGLVPALMRFGFVKSQDLQKHIHRALERRMAALFTVREARSAFYPGDTAPKDPIPLDVDVFAHLTSGVRKYVDADALSGYFERLGDPRVHFDKKSPIDPARLRFNAKELKMLEALDGPALAVSEIVAEMASDDDDMRRTLLTVLLLGHQTGLVASVTRLSENW